MTILRGTAVAGQLVRGDALADLDRRHGNAERDRGASSDEADAIATAVAQARSSGAALIASLGDIVATAIADAFGEIEDRGLAHRAVWRALERHGRSADERICVHPTRVAQLRERLAADGNSDIAARVEGDPLLREDDIILECLYGRMPLAPSQLARRISDRLGS